MRKFSKRIRELIEKIRSCAKTRLEDSSKKRKRLKEDFSAYFQSKINFVKLLFIVINYKLGKQKINNCYLSKFQLKK